MNPLTQSKNATILPLLISLALLISGCQTYPSLHIVRSVFLSPVVVPEVTTGDLRFNVVVKNGGATDSPEAFLMVHSKYYPSWDHFSAGQLCVWARAYKIPALKPGKSSTYGSRIQIVENCPCKKNVCAEAWIQFTLHKAVNVGNVGAQMTGSNTSLLIYYNSNHGQEVVDYSKSVGSPKPK
jgi:hypothetical protein